MAVAMLFLAIAAGGWLLAPRPAGGSWQLTDIEGHLPDLRFTLIDDSGKIANEQEYKGKTVLLYFGFTGCAGQCPVTLARLKTVLQKLGKKADGVRVLFVSVNPANDTPPLLRQYLTAFDPPHMRGLTGSGTAVGELAKRYRAVYRPGLQSMGDLPHSTALYIFDARGRARLLATADDDDAKLEHDVLQLAHGF